MAPIAEETPILEKTKEKGGDSDSEMLNLEKELYSLTHYADDVGELVAQMFNTIKGPKLNAMLPPILKEIPLIDVQQLCLHELRGMSSRRILSIINGVEMSDSSSDDDDDDALGKEKKNKETPKTKEENGDESMDVSEDPNLTELGMNELEMRMKLIKTMLTKDGDEEEGDEQFDPNIKIKEEPPSPETRKSRKTRRRRNESDSASSRSSSRGSYRSGSSASYYSRSSTGSRSYASSSSGCESELQRMKEEARKAGKKKITKKEFEERMKKARMNRTYRKRKDSDNDSANESKTAKRKSKRRGASKKKLPQQEVEQPEDKKEMDVEQQIPEEKEPIEENPEEVVPMEVLPEEEEQALVEEEPEEGEEGEDEVEKEEGEIDSNEELSLSDLSSRSNSSYSGSDSEPQRRRRRDKRRSSKRGKSRSPSVPKVPNWDPSNKAVLPKPIPENRQSISFTFGAKNATKDNDKEVTKEEESQDMSKVQSEDENCDEDATEEEEEEEFVKIDTTEIIGTIDPQEKDANEASKAGDDHSWSTRWLQSEKVQQVVSDSKMLSKVRKNIQAKGKAHIKKGSLKKHTMPVAGTKKAETSLKNPLKMKMVRGAVVDTADAFGLKVNVPQTLPTAKPSKSVAETQAKSKSLSALLGSDDDEDSEDDDLWSQIMKN